MKLTVALRKIIGTQKIFSPSIKHLQQHCIKMAGIAA